MSEPVRFADELPPLPEPTGYMAHDYHLKAWGERDLRAYAAQAVAERDAEIAAEQRRSEVYADLVRRTAEALGLTREDGWHKLPERVSVLCEANECFGKRQEWWTEKMFQLEQERDAEIGRLKAALEKIVDLEIEALAEWSDGTDGCGAAIRARGQE